MVDLTNSCSSSCCLDCTRLLAPVTGVPLLTMRALSKLHSARLSVPVVGDKPHPPIDFAFPFQKFGKKNPTKHSFQARWFKQWKWIHYNQLELHIHVIGEGLDYFYVKTLEPFYFPFVIFVDIL